MAALLERLEKKRKRVFRIREEGEGTAEFEPIRGPLGIWPFPLLNALLLFIIRLREVQRRPVEKVERRRIKTYEFVRDEKGRVIQIIEAEV